MYLTRLLCTLSTDNNVFDLLPTQYNNKPATEIRSRKFEYQKFREKTVESSGKKFWFFADFLKFKSKLFIFLASDNLVWNISWRPISFILLTFFINEIIFLSLLKLNLKWPWFSDEKMRLHSSNVQCLLNSIIADLKLLKFYVSQLTFSKQTIMKKNIQNTRICHLFHLSILF